MISRKMLKIHKWWSSHFVVMLGVIYQILAISPTPPPVSTFLATLGVFTLASIGIASFGQLLNDATDVRQDVRSGTHNLVAANSTWRTQFLFLAVLVVGIVPWFWLPVTPAIVVMLAAEYALFIMYSVPPVRLKDRGFGGPVADALYGYVVPTTVAALVFTKLAGGEPLWMFLLVLFAWGFLYGLGQIIHHQLLDEPRDRAEGIRTFVVAQGWSRSFDFALDVVSIATLAAFLGLLGVEGLANPLIPLGFGVYLVCQLAAWRHRSLGHTARLDRLPRMDRLHFVDQRLLSDFARLWHPLLTLTGLVLRAPDYLPIALLHMAVFPSGLWDLFRYHLPTWRRLVWPTPGH